MGSVGIAATTAAAAPRMASCAMANDAANTPLLPHAASEPPQCQRAHSGHNEARPPAEAARILAHCRSATQ